MFVGQAFQPDRRDAGSVGTSVRLESLTFGSTSRAGRKSQPQLVNMLAGRRKLATADGVASQEKLLNL